MTREEKQKAIDAVERLNALKQFIGYDKDSEIVKATQKSLDMAIKALEQEPCEDCISRQAVEKITWEEPSYSDALNVLTEVRDKVRALPPVTPQSKTGHWILTDDDFVYCSECEDSYYQRPIDASWYYCPHCGAKMESEE